MIKKGFLTEGGFLNNTDGKLLLLFFDDIVKIANRKSQNSLGLEIKEKQ